MATGDVFNVPPSVAPVLETDADGMLYFGEERAGFSRFDRSYIAVAAKAFAEGRDVALVYPSPPTHVQIPILLAVGFQSRSTEPILFVSNRSGIRDQYFELGMGEKYGLTDGISPTPLGDATAPLVKTGDGSSLSYITNHKPRHWNPEKPETTGIVHTTFGKKITTTLSPDLDLSGFVLDFTTGLLDDEATQEAYRNLAEERDIPRLMVFDSPNHPYLETLESQNRDDEDVLFWGWMASALESAPQQLLEPVADTNHHEGSASSNGGTVQSPFADSVRSLENIRNGINRSIVDIAYSDLETAAKRAYERLSSASSFPKDTSDSYSPMSRQAITNGYFLYMYFDTLPISVEFHDSLSSLDDTQSWGTAATLQSKVNRLRDQASQLDRDVPGSGGILEEACDAFDAMVDLLAKHNPKADAIVEQIRDIREEGNTICVFTATRKQESLLRSFVAEKTEFGRNNELTENIFFHSLYSPHTVPQADVAIFPGVPTKSHYPAVQTGAVSEQRFLTYKWDIGRLESRLSDIIETAEWRVGPGVQHHTARELGLETDGLKQYVDLEEPRSPQLRRYSSEERSGSARKPFKLDVPTRRSGARSLSESERVGSSPTLTGDDFNIDLGSLAPEQIANGDARNWNGELEYDDGLDRETIDGGRTNTDRDMNGEVRALEIELSAGNVLYEEPGGLVWTLESSNGSVNRVRRSAASLSPGDQVILIQDDSRRDVFEHVVEKIHTECRGQFRENLVMLDIWNSGLDQMVDYWSEMQEELNQDPTQLNIKMGRREIAEIIADELQVYAEEFDAPEVVREPQTIFNYLTRDTIGPSSSETIQALGVVNDIESLQNHHLEIHRGLESIRRLHMQVGRKLEQIIFSSRSADSDEWILKEAGLRVEDVQDATVVEQVVSVSKDTITVSESDIGRLRRFD